MARIVANVFAGGQWWGPSHASDVPSPEAAIEITNPKCWEGGEVPAFVVEAQQDSSGSEEPGPASPGAAGPGDDADAQVSAEPSQAPDLVPDLSWLTDPTEGPSVEHELPPVPPVVDTLLDRHLADVPDDKDALLAFADAHNIDVNRRLGVENLRTAITDAIGD